MGSSISSTRRAPADSADSWIARRSTAVEPEGTQMMTWGAGEAAPIVNLADEMLDHLLRHLEIGDDAVAAARMAEILPGCGSIIFASSRTARTRFLP